MQILTASLFAIAGFTFASTALAQSPARPKPPGVEVVEEIPSPTDAKEIKVTTRKSGTDTIEEHRIGGRLYKQRIQPESGPAYYLIDEKGEGKFIRSDGPDLKTSVPMWVLWTW